MLPKLKCIFDVDVSIRTEFCFDNPPIVTDYYLNVCCLVESSELSDGCKRSRTIFGFLSSNVSFSCGVLLSCVIMDHCDFPEPSVAWCSNTICRVAPSSSETICAVRPHAVRPYRTRR